MQKSFIKSLAITALTALAVMLSPNALAQLTSTGMSGIVRSPGGAPVAGAKVTATFVPTNATFTAITNADGRYTFRNILVGGPYTITASAEGHNDTPVTDVTTLLGTDVEVNVTLSSDVVQLEKFTISGERNELDAGATGAGTLIGGQTLATKPSSERSLADMVSASPLVTLRSTFGDREESQLTAVGQNNRFNSFQIDGSRINDMFGLNGTGLASFFNPLSLDTVEQISAQVAPYDVRQAGFTGASINVITKSGTNEFHGSLTYYFRGDSVAGIALQGYNSREYEATGTKFTPRLERRTIGATFGGPIIKDKLFFFLSYEDTESTIAGRDARFIPNASNPESTILSRLDQIASAAGKDIDWGQPVTESTANTTVEEKISAKVDWQINANHRASVRYTTTEGEVPQFGNYASTSLTVNGVASGGAISAPTGHFYSQTRKEETIAARLNSQWNSNFSTEIKYAHTTQDQLTPLNTVGPMILITGLAGNDLVTGQSITNGGYVVGTEQFRHGNVINVDSDQMSATGDYTWRNFVFSGGFEREQTDFYNLFRQGSYGLVAYRNYADFLADTNAVITRNVYDPNVRDVADVSDLATTGIFGQVKWDINTRLWITAGLRYEFVESSEPPPYNAKFFTDTGFRNDGTVDGTSSLSPRVGFNLALDDTRTTQIRGGIGHFFGRAPWVIFSNSYGQTGVGSFTLQSAQGQLPTSLGGYLAQFDPANPIGTGVDNPNLQREVNWVDNGIELPQSWRGNLAIDRKLSFLDSQVTLEVVHSVTDQALFVTNENLRPTTVGADGRQLFAGNPSTAANRKYIDYLNLIRVQNTGIGESTYFTAQWSRPMKNKWAFDLAYTRGKATEAQAIGQTTAGGQFNRNVVFNQNVATEGRADFEIRDRVQLTLAREFEFVKNWKTTTSLYYEGRTGNPYSWVFGGDLNLDGVTFNDTVAVPSGIDDSRFDFSLMPVAQRDAFLAYVASSELAKYAGGIAPKNAWYEPWVNRLDLKFMQNVPIRGSAKLQLFFDFVNFGAFLSKDFFGYTEIAPFLSNDVFRTRTLTNATTYGPDGRIRPTFTSAPAGFTIDNGMSRWRVQLGAKLQF